MTFTLSFHGGAGTVTGSRFLVESESTRFLVDAGMFQGLKRLREMNWDRPKFDPASLDCLLLTHAHIDHSGYLPRLVKQGFRGPVFCTDATADLSQLLLLDAAKLAEEDAAFANKTGRSKHHPALPLFEAKDAESAVRLMEPVEYREWFEPRPGVRAMFRNAGHILGGAMVEVLLQSGGKETRVVFSGDIGRYGVPLHSDPDPLPACDVLVVESTYGDREHDPKSVDEQIREAFLGVIERGGTALIPSFAVGRAQLVTLILRQLIEAGRLPEVPIHIDSPMAVDATRIYSRYLSDLSLDESLTQDGRSLLFPKNVQFHRSVEESKRLNDLPGPRIIISASGMLTAGRVLHHLKRLLPDPKNLVLLVGFQVEGTRGRAMLEGARTVRVHGEDVPVNAQFIGLGGLSGHGDRTELLRWVRTAPTPPRRIFVTHGEPEASRALAQLLETETGSGVVVPGLGASFELEG